MTYHEQLHTAAILTLWPHVYPLLEPAIDMMHGLHTADTVLERLIARRAELWTSDNSAVITEFVEYPHGRCLHFWLAGGDLDELKAMEPEIVAWGRTQGCVASSISGRRGWLRELPGYEEAATVMFKRIDG